jgi:pyrroloquinoline quinone (PQQ) biosynthesis protein C
MLHYRPTTMSSEEATKIVDELYVQQLELGQRLIGNGRFLTEMKAGTLPAEALRVFWLNWSSFVAEVNNIIQCAYQRHVGFFKQHLDLLGPFADKVADELIHPKPPGHLLVVWQQGEIFGLSRDEIINYQMLPGCRALLEYLRGLLYEGTLIEFWASMSTEEYIGHWAQAFRGGLATLGYQRGQAPYFDQHAEADLEVHEDGVMGHGQFNRAVIARIIETGNLWTRPGFTMEYAADLSMRYLAMFHDAVYDHVVSGVQ